MYSEPAPPHLEIPALVEWYKNTQIAIEDNEKMIDRLKNSPLPEKNEMVSSSKLVIEEAKKLANIIKSTLKNKYNIDANEAAIG